MKGSVSLVPPARSTVAPVAEVDREEIVWRNTLLTMVEAAAYLRYTGEGAANPAKAAADSVYCFLKRHRVRVMKRGNYLLVRRGDIDRVLEHGQSDFVDRARAAMRTPRGARR